MLFADMLSFATGVGGCYCTISSRGVRMDVSFWYFSNNPPNSDTISYAMMFLLILNSTCTGTFSRDIAVIGVLGFVARGGYPPALLHASGSEI